MKINDIKNRLVKQIMIVVEKYELDIAYIEFRKHRYEGFVVALKFNKENGNCFGFNYTLSLDTEDYSYYVENFDYIFERELIKFLNSDKK